MKKSYCTSSYQYTKEKSQARTADYMEQDVLTPPITYYDSIHKMQVTITFTKEITMEEVDTELTSLLESHYTAKILGKP